MAPKRCYDAGRLGEAAEEAAKRAQASHGNDVTFTCSYSGVVGGGEVKKTAMAQFTWRAVAGEFNEEHTVQVQCGNACAQGIPLPAPLKAASRRARMARVAEEAEGVAAKEFFDGAVVTCRLDHVPSILSARVC